MKAYRSSDVWTNPSTVPSQLSLSGVTTLRLTQNEVTHVVKGELSVRYDTQGINKVLL
jgi:hypothetical protein